MLLPALNKARESAKTVSCLSNMRQVMMALTMYAQDNKNFLPWVCYFPVNTSDARYWPSRLTGSGQYLKNRDVLFCPSRVPLGGYSQYMQDVRDATTEIGWVWGYTSYSANRYGAMPVGGPGYPDAYHRIKLSETKVPASNLMVLTEGYYAPYTAQAYSLWGISEAVPNAYSLWTHGSVTNCAFLDGHCASLQADELGWNYKTRAWLPKASDADYQLGAPWYMRVLTLN
jgi:prepilin-type processing-associated H-X9-DG protein